MTVFTEGTRPWGFIVSEAHGSLSREAVTVIAGTAVLKPGTVMGERADGKWAQLDPAATEGNEAAKGILGAQVDPTDGAGGVGSDVPGVVIERLAEVRDADLVWPDGINTADQNTAEGELLARNIKIRAVATVVSTQST
jgi:hypothetical protein